MRKSKRIQERSASNADAQADESERCDVDSLVAPAAKRTKSLTVASDEIPYDTDEDERAKEVVPSDGDTTRAPGSRLLTDERPDFMSKLPKKTVTIAELNTFISSNMSALNCWIHVERLPRHDVKGLGAVLGGFSIYTFVHGDLRWTRHKCLASLKEVFASVQRDWYLDKETHAPIGLLLEKVIIEENNQWILSWLEAYCRSYASPVNVMDQDPKVLIWENVGYRLDTHTWFTEGSRFDMVSEFFTYALEMSEDGLSINVSKEEEEEFNKQMLDILGKQFKVDAFIRKVASALSNRYSEVRGHMTGGCGGNLKSEMCELLAFTFKGRCFRLSNTYFYGMKEKQRKFRIAKMHQILLVLVNEMQEKQINAEQFKDLLGGQVVDGLIRRNDETTGYCSPGILVWSFNLNNLQVKTDRAITRRTLAVEYTKVFDKRPSFMKNITEWRSKTRLVLISIALKYLKRRKGWVRFPPQSYADSLFLLSSAKRELIAWLFTHYVPTETGTSQVVAIKDIYQHFTKTADTHTLKECPSTESMREFLKQIPYVPFSADEKEVYLKVVSPQK